MHVCSFRFVDYMPFGVFLIQGEPGRTGNAGSAGPVGPQVSRMFLL